MCIFVSCVLFLVNFFQQFKHTNLVVCFLILDLVGLIIHVFYKCELRVSVKLEVVEISRALA